KTLYEMHQDDASVFYFEKTRFSAFAGTNLELKLRERGINEVHLVGVCTDICILHTAIEAYNKGFDIVVHKDAVASFNQPGHECARGYSELHLRANLSHHMHPQHAQQQDPHQADDAMTTEQ